LGRRRAAADGSNGRSEHYEELEALLARLGADPEAGLAPAVLEAKRREHGPHALPLARAAFDAFPAFARAPATAVALRDGREREVLAQDLVPGDVVVLQARPEPQRLQRLPQSERLQRPASNQRLQRPASRGCDALPREPPAPPAHAAWLRG
jgi:hypothetical protein